MKLKRSRTLFLTSSQESKLNWTPTRSQTEPNASDEGSFPSLLKHSYYINIVVTSWNSYRPNTALSSSELVAQMSFDICTVIRHKLHMSSLQSGPEKITQSLMHHHFATVHRTITWFAKCSAKTVLSFPSFIAGWLWMQRLVWLSTVGAEASYSVAQCTCYPRCMQINRWMGGVWLCQRQVCIV